MRYNEQSNPTGIFEASTTVSILFSLINAILIFKSICFVFGINKYSNSNLKLLAIYP